ncbi:OPT family small oligopeptide transporter [Phycomyces blakesleeanus]|uniref:OPT family small oligopeptide transporter n=1 Tax=Phycomyces blakesleeanus TaxID=4837 RepID=A0ABR3AQS5_PHYBL
METTLTKREVVSETASFEKSERYLDEKAENELFEDSHTGPTDIRDIDYENNDLDLKIVNQIASIEDDPTIKVLTIRSVVVGVLLGCLGASVYQLMLFKPVPVILSDMFMLILAYLICHGSTRVFKSGTLLNPGPFNIKEHTFIYFIIATANTSAYGTYVLGAQQLYYTESPSAAGGIFLLFATQIVGYGIAGQLRPFLVYPSQMIWPTSLPTVSFLKTFNTPGNENKTLIRFFFIIFFGIFVWEIVPQYMFPLLGGVSIRIFGGVQTNEGLGIASLSFDWSYLSSLSPFVLPLFIQFNIYAGIVVLWILFPLVYYYDVWYAKSFPFLANGLYKLDPETRVAIQYPQSLVIDEHNNINLTALAEVGRPYFGTTYALQYIFINFGVTAMISHVALFNGAEIKRIALSIFKHRKFREDDIHNRLMAAYKEVPAWWYYAIFVLGIGLNIGIGYANKSALPWWGFLFAILLSTVLSLPLNMITAIAGTGFGLNVVAEMICGFILPGNAVANMYFKTLGYNTMNQAGAMAADLKIGHYLKVPPRLTFLAQMIGTVVGCVFNYIINYTIINSKRDQLLDVNGNIWSGARPQSMNSAAITWGAIGPMVMFGPDTDYYFFLWAFVVGFALPVPFWILHKFYPKVGFNLVNIPLFLYGLCILPGSNSSWITVSFIITLVSQLFIKRRYSKWYAKHNYLMSAALDSGTSLMSFILAMTVFGGGDGINRPFPTWAGNNEDIPYYDYCCADCE